MPSAQSPQVSLATELTKRLLQLPNLDLESARYCKEKLVELWPKHNSFTDTTTVVDLVGLVGIAVVATQILDTPEGFNSSQGARVDLLEQLVIFSQNDPQVLDYVRKDLNRLSKNYQWQPNTHAGWEDLRDYSGTRALTVSGNIHVSHFRILFVNAEFCTRLYPNSSTSAYDCSGLASSSLFSPVSNLRRQPISQSSAIHCSKLCSRSSELTILASDKHPR